MITPSFLAWGLCLFDGIAAESCDGADATGEDCAVHAVSEGDDSQDRDADFGEEDRE